MDENTSAVIAAHTLDEATAQEAKRLIVGVLSRAVADPEYERRLRSDPKGTITEFATRMENGELNEAELEAVAGGDELWVATREVLTDIGAGAHVVVNAVQSVWNAI